MTSITIRYTTIWFSHELLQRKQQHSGAAEQSSSSAIRCQSAAKPFHKCFCTSYPRMLRAHTIVRLLHHDVEATEVLKVMCCWATVQAGQA